MNKKDLLLLASTTDNEKTLVSLLSKLNKSNSKELVAESLAFKNVLLLVKSDLNNNILNQLLLKNYVFFLFATNSNNIKYTKSSKEEGLITTFNNCLLNGNVEEAMNLLNKNISIKYYLSYIYVSTITEKGLYRVTNIQKDNYEQVGNLLEKINYETVHIESLPKRNRYAKVRCISSNR